MIGKRTIVLSALALFPLGIYLVLGCVALWRTGVVSWVWWLLPICWLLTWLLARVWRPADPQSKHDLSPPGHWTPRDQGAAEIVRRYQKKVDNLSMEQLTDLHFYLEEIKALSLDMARHYHPETKDPVSSLTAPEVLAAVRLAIDDMEWWMLTSAPGSRLLTIGQWRMLRHAPKWVRRLQNMAWGGSILVNPANVARYLSSKVTIQPVTAELQAELLMALYLRFIRQVGFYLIEMNSGRLRGGADAYRRAFPQTGGERPQVGESTIADERPDRKERPSTGVGILEVDAVTVSLVGQVSSGKSSLINALTGSQDAAVDVLPETREVERYRFELGSPPVDITLLDTPGYGEAGASQAQLAQIQAALRESHAVLLVMDAHSPARDTDVRTQRELEDWYQSQPKLKPPPMIGVLTHIDLLPPSLDWHPPPNWREPKSPKDVRIEESVEYSRELFGGALANVVPVCTAADDNRRWGVFEELLPALTTMLDDAHSAALLRAFEQTLDRDHFRTLLSQLQRSGSDLLQCWIEERLQTASSQHAE